MNTKLIACVLLFIPRAVPGDYLELTKTANVYYGPDRHTTKFQRLDPDNYDGPLYLRLVRETRENGYYKIHRTAESGSGWIYKTRVRRRSGIFPATDTVFANSPLASDEMRIHFIDVGQGDATLLEFVCGAILIDSEGEKNPYINSTTMLMNYINEFFDTRPHLENTLDSFFLTHPRIDHTRGATKLAESAITVRNFVENGFEEGSGIRQQKKWRKLAKDASEVGYENVRLVDIPEDTGMTDEIIDPVDRSPAIDPIISVLWGGVEEDPGWGRTRRGKLRFENSNIHSVVVRVDFGEASFLITGDLEEVAIEDIVERYEGTDLLDVDVYQVGHHGSRNGTTDSLVAEISPKIAVFST